MEPHPWHFDGVERWHDRLTFRDSPYDVLGRSSRSPLYGSSPRGSGVRIVPVQGGGWDSVAPCLMVPLHDTHE